MTRYHYHLVDVFTDRQFGGNQLAVFTDGRGLTTELMQTIAKELNLSESTFVFPPEDPKSNFRVRIFTPGAEMPMAGHPTVGTGFVLAREGFVEASGVETTTYFQENVGIIPVVIKFKDGAPDLVQMTQLLPTFGPTFDDRQAIAEMLSLDVEALDENLPIEVVSCGVPFIYVPLKNLQAVKSIRFRLDAWDRALKDFTPREIFAFTQEVDNQGSTVHSRMFAPGLGVYEDPATGAASGPLGCYLVRHGLVPPAPTVRIVSEQGIELGRPSFVQIEIDQENGRITAVRVGGRVASVGGGYIETSQA